MGRDIEVGKQKGEATRSFRIEHMLLGSTIVAKWKSERMLSPRLGKEHEITDATSLYATIAPPETALRGF